MNCLVLGPTRLPELYGFVVLVNNSGKFISCLFTVAKSLTELLQKSKNWVTGMPNSMWCSYTKVCVFWYCFICDLVLWFLPHGSRSCDLTLIARWQREAQSACTDKRWGKNSCTEWLHTARKEALSWSPERALRYLPSLKTQVVARVCSSFPNDTRKKWTSFKMCT